MSKLETKLGHSLGFLSSPSLAGGGEKGLSKFRHDCLFDQKVLYEGPLHI
jgi:hypothetical protein